MNIRTLSILLGITFLSVIGIEAQLGDGSVHFMTNQPTNEVVSFSRDSRTGKLTLVDTEPTQGIGNPIPIEPDPSVDPLASQGSLIVDEKGNYVYAVNAGSNDISVLAVEPRGLRFVQKISSGGTRPISLTIYRRLLYVLNEGDPGNISGFSLGSGGLAADPAQVRFTPNGRLIVVTYKGGNSFGLYFVDENGAAGPATAAPSIG